MRFNCVNKVIFHQLNEDKYDRKGDIATFYSNNVTEALTIICSIISLIEYVDNEYAIRHGSHNIVVVHRFWSESRVAAFCNMVKILCREHYWKFEDHRFEYFSIEEDMINVRR